MRQITFLPLKKSDPKFMQKFKSKKTLVEEMAAEEAEF